MPLVEVTLPDDVWAEFERIAEGEFQSQEEAIEHLLSEGLRTYNREFDDGATEADVSEEFAEDIWDTAEDPAADRDGGGDDYSF